MSIKTRCRGCGYCCIQHRRGCGVSIERHGYFINGDLNGPCPDLIWKGYRYFCRAVMVGRHKREYARDLKLLTRCGLPWNKWRENIQPRRDIDKA